MTDPPDEEPQAPARATLRVRARWPKCRAPVDQPLSGAAGAGLAVSARDLPPRPRFPARRPFTLAPTGRAAEASYRAVIVAARQRPGRTAFDAARVEWAEELGLEPDDGIYLGELLIAPRSVHQLTEALVICGKSRSDTMAAVGRLVDAGLIWAPTIV